MHLRRTVSAGGPSRLRTFDPIRLGDLEYQAWVGYYRRRWPRVLLASVGLVRTGFGVGWYRTLWGAWLVLRANQLWAPYPDNDAERAQACMRRFYALVRRAYGEPAHPAGRPERWVVWGGAPAEAQHGDRPPPPGGTEPATELVQSLTRLYSYLYGEPERALRPAALHRARGMDLVDEVV